MIIQQGPGTVPAQNLLAAAAKQAQEILSEGVQFVHTSGDPSLRLEFTASGHSVEQVRAFLLEALEAGHKTEPTVESGNKYGVCNGFHEVNSKLLLEALERSDICKGLSKEEALHALSIFNVVFSHPEMRNRNVLHAGMLDSSVIGNLLNFPKHIFGFSFGSHATDGNEALSLCLFSYRQLYGGSEDSDATFDTPSILYVKGPSSRNNDAEEDVVNLRRCAQRLGMEVVVCNSASGALGHLKSQKPAVMVSSLNHPDIEALAECSRNSGVDLHIHVLDCEWRDFFASHASPVHFDVPTGVRSISIEEGLFCSGLAVYRDATLRDMHLDVGYGWQTAYMSPNEGGSGASTPLFLDFCITMLGWRLLGKMAKGGGGGAMMVRSCSINSSDLRTLHPTLIPPFNASKSSTEDWEWKACLSDGAFADMISKTPSQILNWEHPLDKDVAISWGMSSVGTGTLIRPAAGEEKKSSTPKTSMPERVHCRPLTRENLEALLVHFQRDFLGGKDRSLEVFSTGGGTRSINLAFESVIASRMRHCEKFGFEKSRVKVLTGNPHLAVERAERRFNFELKRLPREGALCPLRLRNEITDLSVAAVYSQTLSFTDGISDPLEDILKVVESENQRRAKLQPPGFPVILINDCCLAFSILVHNDGSVEGGTERPLMRLLDMSYDHVTPIIVTLDAHKHIGSDKGISTVIGTSGTLSVLDGRVKVGAQPGRNDLIRAITCMRLMGRQAYVDIYKELGGRVAKLVTTIEKAGMHVIHKEFRALGSTVISVEDPSGLMSRKLGKRGHYVARIFGVAPEYPDRCQTGWQLSLTPYALRSVQKNVVGKELPGRVALDVFTDDVLAAHAEVQQNQTMRRVWEMTRENSLVACVIGGNLDPYLLPLLTSGAGIGRSITRRVVRRFFTASMDCGVVHTQRHLHPVSTLLKRLTFLFVAALLLRRAVVAKWLLRRMLFFLPFGR